MVKIIKINVLGLRCQSSFSCRFYRLIQWQVQLHYAFYANIARHILPRSGTKSLIILGHSCLQEHWNIRAMKDFIYFPSGCKIFSRKVQCVWKLPIEFWFDRVCLVKCVYCMKIHLAVLCDNYGSVIMLSYKKHINELSGTSCTALLSELIFVASWGKNVSKRADIRFCWAWYPAQQNLISARLSAQTHLFLRGRL